MTQEITSPKLVVQYTRVSTHQQSTLRQKGVGIGLKSFQKVYEDKGVSGSIPFTERPQGRVLLEDARKGLIGEIHVVSVDRLGRNIQDIHHTIGLFTNLKVCIVIEKEGIRTLNQDGTRNHTGDMVLSVMACVAQMEKDIIVDRVKQGIAVARAVGRYSGRKKGTTESTYKFLNKPKSKKIVEMLDEGLYPISHISKILGVSRMSVYKVQRLRQSVMDSVQS
jgi:DNA invertase Pin-like site-specific DNA recombinase